MTKEELKKEAEKWIENNLHSTEEDYVKAFKDGAEFGYNFAKEEIDYLNKHWRSEEERKANEWHFVKDELPDEGTYLVVWQNDKGYKEIFIMNYEEDDEEELHWVDGDYEVQDEYVIAWKELPELPKESE